MSALLLTGGLELAAKLPAPIDIPAGPPAVEAPPSAALPALAGSAAANAPAISMISESTLPDETLVITGSGLKEAHLRIWSGETLSDVRPLRAAEDRMQAVVPADWRASMMLVWPVLNERVGAPIRVNGTTAWWLWPARAEANSTGQTMRIFGRNLVLGGTAPRVYLRGPGTDAWLPVIDSNPYALEATLPDDLAPGSYEVWAHNGSGSWLGWSEGLSLEVAAMPSRHGLPTFDVTDFGARPDDARDDWQAISSALRAAEDAGGGEVRLRSGTYHLSRALEVRSGEGAGVHIIGAGMGDHRWHNRPAPNDHKVVHEIEGAATVIRPAAGQPFPNELLRISRRHSSLRDLTFLNHADAGKQRCLSIAAHDVRVEHVRGIVVDERPLFTGWDKPEEEVTSEEFHNRLQDGTVMRIDAPGRANIVVQNCEFHHPGAGVDTPFIGSNNSLIGHSRATGICPPGTDFIRIVDCTFRGYFDGRLEPVDQARRFQAYRGWHNMAWINNNSKNVIIERCDIAGADKNNFKVITRSLNHKNTSIRDLYLAHNTGYDLAPTSLTPGNHENKGEQMIFHLSYPQGGLFDVVAAGGRSLTLNPDDPKYDPDGSRHPGVAFNGPAYSVVPDDVDVNPTHWIVFVSAGRGVGQYRVVEGCERGPDGVTLHLQQPWRVPPDASSRITLNAAFRRIIIYENHLDAGPHADPLVKSHGVTFWANAFENIIAKNTFRNFTGGVVINSFYRCPTGWNLTVGNRMERIRGNGGDTVFPGKAAFYVDHIRVLDPRPEDRVWYSVGNIARGNHGISGDVTAYLHRPDYARIDPETPYLSEANRKLLMMPRGDNTVVGYSYPDTPHGGLMMSVMENNRFEGAREGVIVSSPLNWLLLRNNRIDLIVPDAPVVDDESASTGTRGGVRDLLIIQGSNRRSAAGRHQRADGGIFPPVPFPISTARARRQQTDGPIRPPHRSDPSHATDPTDCLSHGGRS